LEGSAVTKSEKACRAIESAKNESEVVEVVCRYLDSLEASDAAQLPAQLIVTGLTPAEELIHAALQALQGCMDKGAAPAGGIVSETAAVFTTAAQRLGALADESP
jgi:hypothetical protein